VIRRVPSPLATMAAWSWRILVIAIPIYFLIQFLTGLWPLLAAIGVALFFTALLKPLADWLHRHRWPRWAGALATVLGMLLAFAALGWWIAPQVASQLSQIGPRLRQSVQQGRQWLIEGPLGLSPQRVEQLRDDVVARLPLVGESAAGTEATGGAGGGGAGGAAAADGFVVPAAMLTMEVLAFTLFAIVLSFFLIKDGDEITNWVVGQLDERRQDAARALGRSAWEAFAGYIQGIAILATFNAVASGIAYAIIGVPLFLALAVIEFFFSFIPLVGALTAGLLAAVIALAAGGATDALLVVGVAIAIEQIEGNIIEPFVVGPAVKLHPAVVLVIVAAGGLLAGILGALIAVPITAILAAVVGCLREQRNPGVTKVA
jgi:predicted PurR-regulated permease PerM